VIRLQQLREQQGLSKKALSERARIAQGIISKAERGMFFYPTELERLAEALGVPAEESATLLDEV